MAELVGQEGDHEKELQLLQQALKHNPLDRELRERTAKAHLTLARDEAVNKHYDQARAHYQTLCNTRTRAATASSFVASPPAR